MRLLLDTNILIDYFGQRRPYFDDWYKLEIMQMFGDAELWVFSESFTDAFYVLKGAVDTRELQRAFVESLEFLNVCAVDGSVISKAGKREWSDFEDCVISVCAENAKCDYMITRDKSGFKKSRIPAMSIPDFFKHIESEYGLVYDEVKLRVHT